MKLKNKGINTISKITSIIVVILLLSYYIINITMVCVISNQLTSIKDHPFPVSLSAGKVVSSTKQLKLLAERMEYINSLDSMLNMKENIDEIHIEVIESLETINLNYLESKEEAELLEDKYNHLIIELGNLLEIAANVFRDNSIYDTIIAFNQTVIYPLTDEIIDIGNNIMDTATNKFYHFENLAYQSKITTMILSTFLLIIVLASIVMYHNLIKKKSSDEEALRDTLRGALEASQIANRAKSQFLSNMSHDIRTPMNAVIGMTAIAGMNIDDKAKVKNCLNKIAASSKHLLGLINDVLDMSKIESGKVALNDEPIELSELIKGVTDIVQSQAKSKQLNFDVVLCDLDHENVIGDTLRINQVLLNIIGNAIKFTEPEGSIKLSIKELAPNFNGYATYQFEISDTGIGMTDEFIEKIFDPFERARNTTTSRIEGTGLGMSITKSIVDMMNGKISVQSEIGKGSKFTVILHLRLSESERANCDCNQFKDLKTLVVDDDIDVCENTSRLLKEIGMQAEWVTSGKEAVILAEKAYNDNDNYHSMIIDWKMPIMDGIETTRRIRDKIGDEMPIIILTAYDWSDIEEEAKSAGVNAFISKPLFKSRLYQVMSDLTNNNVINETIVKTETIHKKGRALLVEDNQMNMEIAQEFINYCGMNYECAWNGEEALDKIKNHEDGYFDIVFMDVQMPIMNGYDATEAIRIFEMEDHRNNVPIIAMSANAFSEDVDKALALGMNGYLTKPVSMSEMQAICKKFMEDKE